MNIQEIRNNDEIRPLKYPLRETPHLTIEPNRTCNINCRVCYTLNKDSVKSLDDVKKEIDLAIGKRKLRTISLLGGEPTLHPHLMEIIRYIRRKGVQVQLLTNGILLLESEDGRFVDELIRAGINRILVHIDEGQAHIHGKIERARNTLFSRLEGKKVPFSLSLTVYEENRGEISNAITKYSKFKFFNGILAVLARDPLRPQRFDAQLSAVYKQISRTLHVEPTTYIPSNVDDSHISWLIYFYFINARTQKILGVSPGVDGILRKMYRVLTGHQLFAPVVKRRALRFLLILIGLMEGVRHPARIKTFFELVKHSNLTEAIRFHFIAVQTPPELNKMSHQYQICHSCPDATIRNGMLTPVCVADRINPINERNKKTETPEDLDLYLTAYRHLEEI